MLTVILVTITFSVVSIDLYWLQLLLQSRPYLPHLRLQPPPQLPVSHTWWGPSSAHFAGKGTQTSVGGHSVAQPTHA